MRHEVIDMVCAHVGQDRESPPHHGDALVGIGLNILYTYMTWFNCLLSDKIPEFWV